MAEEDKKSKGTALVIVESPAKTKTIKKILGNGYRIEASFGHIRDLPSKDLGFDVEHDFKPTFVVIPEKKKVVTKLNDLAKTCDKVYLASDPDREGEAIAWHVRQVLKVPDEKVFRIEFNEITPKAVKYAVDHSRQIDMDKVKAQQTRQILDKLVGYKLSPVLWKKLGNYKLSAGRVQSVALRMICEREDEIEAFVPVEYWSIHTIMAKDDGTFEAELSKYKNKKIEIKNQEEAQKIVDFLLDKSTNYEVTNITNRTTKRKPTAPFITSTLQREASSKLGYGVQKTMQIAQKLYEGIEIDGGAAGLITYMRTDSVRVSDDAQVMAKDFILKNFGEEYYPKTPNVYAKGKQNVQDAHEAIRPAYPDRTPDSIKKYLTPEQYKLYKLIWNKFMSSQMEAASVANKAVEISAGDYTLRASTSKVTFEGFLKLYVDTSDDEDGEKPEEKIPDLNKGDKLTCRKVEPKQHFTQPPPRFSEASLVKALEEYGIGRPSTYASIITKIQTRKYVDKKDRTLFPTLLGRTVSKQLCKQFTEIMDYKFTAGMEGKLDKIADKKAVWTKVLKDFYDPFIVTVDKAMQEGGKVLVDSGIKCPNCGKPMVLRTSKYGTQFLGCSGYPECKTLMSMDVLSENIGESGDEDEHKEPEQCNEKCEKCGSPMIFKMGPYGKYMECTNADCRHRKPYRRSTGVKCPKCGKGEIVERKSKRGTVFYGCSSYPDCDFTLWNEPTGEVCPTCGALLVKKILKNGEQIVCSNRSCQYKKEQVEGGNDA
ncbi:MAG: type I DNA topoisomerase [Clostridiaceae bacterium]|jgi:DNA topoisomerase I|nr:type I DNA topoisomerase [Clostridiaceae bacterium]